MPGRWLAAVDAPFFPTTLNPPLAEAVTDDISYDASWISLQQRVAAYRRLRQERTGAFFTEPCAERDRAAQG